MSFTVIIVRSYSLCPYRARRLRATLKQQSQAVTVLAKHMRTYLQQKRYGEMKKRHYAAIKIQAVFRWVFRQFILSLYDYIIRLHSQFTSSQSTGATVRGSSLRLCGLRSGRRKGSMR